ERPARTPSAATSTRRKRRRRCTSRRDSNEADHHGPPPNLLQSSSLDVRLLPAHGDSLEPVSFGGVELADLRQRVLNRSSFLEVGCDRLYQPVASRIRFAIVSGCDMSET